MTEEKIIAFCGICCSDCPAYKATIANDDEMRKDVAEKWTSDECPLTAQEVHCLGCPKIDTPVMCFVGKCEVRLCAVDKGVENCAYCEDYACDILQKVWGYVGDDEAKKNLDSICKNLK